MKVGDKVKMSNKNPNHLGFGVCAYAGMEGTVLDLWEDNAFSLKCDGSTLVVPLSNKKGVWIWLNGKHVFHKRIKPKSNRENWFQLF